jgi:hypothetical protein
MAGRPPTTRGRPGSSGQWRARAWRPGRGPHTAPTVLRRTSSLHGVDSPRRQLMPASARAGPLSRGSGDARWTLRSNRWASGSRLPLGLVTSWMTRSVCITLPAFVLSVLNEHCSQSRVSDLIIATKAHARDHVACQSAALSRSVNTRSKSPGVLCRCRQPRRRKTMQMGDDATCSHMSFAL